MGIAPLTCLSQLGKVQTLTNKVCNFKTFVLLQGSEQSRRGHQKGKAPPPPPAPILAPTATSTPSKPTKSSPSIVSDDVSYLSPTATASPPTSRRHELKIRPASMVDAATTRSRSRDSIETSRDTVESGHKKKKDHQRPKSVHESVAYDRKEEKVEKRSPVIIQHKEVYSMEEILKEQTGMTSVHGPEVGIEEFQEEEEEEEGGGHDDVRFSPEKEQALQTLDDVIQAAEESMSKS